MIAAAVGLAAALYASVGHGGASAYLAIMALAGRPQPEAASAALVLNLIVSAASAAAFARAGHSGLRLAGRFLAGSVPAAFAGGWLRLSPGMFNLLLALCLVAAALRLLLPLPGGSGREPRVRPPALPIAIGVGAAIGFLSGALGIGGGIILSPLLLLAGWAGPKRTAGAAAAFILVNSAAGLAARLASGQFVAGGAFALVPVAVVGGLAGAWLGAHRLPGRTLVRTLCAVLLLAAAGAILT